MASHGGKRKGAGRKVTGVKPTKIIRVQEPLLELIQAIQIEYKKTGCVPEISYNSKDVTFNQVLSENERMKEKISRLSQVELPIQEGVTFNQDSEVIEKPRCSYITTKGTQCKAVKNLSDYGAEYKYHYLCPRHIKLVRQRGS